MNTSLKWWRALWVVALAFVFQGLAVDPAAAESKPRAVLLVGQTVNDAGFGQAGYLGIEGMKKGGFETTMVENIKAPDQEATARDFASKGYDIVFGHGFEFQAHFFKVAPDFPNTKFIVNKGAPKPETPDNLLIIDIKEHQPAYLLGVLAAHLTKTKKVSGIAGFHYGTIIRIMEAFRDGVASVDPSIKVNVAYAGTWMDPVKGKEIALAHIGEGADVVYAHASVTSLGIIEAAKEKGVLAYGSVLDQNSVAPETVVAGSLYDFPVMFLDVGKSVKDGTFKGGAVSYGMAEGVVDITPFYGAAAKLPADVKAKLEALRKDIKSGKFVVKEIRKKRS
ncbi:MAG: BMP family protein [Alphaproteobacteria bacterium]|nr:BMP family protein [Alphaproteobacteria bacterium]